MEASVCNSVLSFSNCHVCTPSFTNVPKHSLVAATSFRSKSFLKLSLRGYSSTGAQRSDSTGRRWNVRAAQDEDGVDSEVSTSTSQTPIPGSDKRAKAKAEQEKGQNTARVTGAVAVLLGVAYLVLVQLLDTRGVILVPPPPEAFDP